MTTKIRLLHDTVGIPTGAVAVTQSASDNTTKVATTAYVTTALANLADSAPSTLNTLNELAAALGDDANFSTTVTNSIATKLPLAGGTMTGNLTLYSSAPVLAIKDGGTHGTNSTPYLEFRDGSSVQSSIGITNTAGDLSVWNTKNTTLRFATNNTQRMTIDSSGKVGIGCTPTGFATEIQATSGGNALKLRGRNASENAGWLAWTDYADNVEAAMYATADNLIFANTTSYTERMRIDASGDVGIGTTPVKNSSYNTVLHVHGSGNGSSVRITDNNDGTATTKGLELLQYSNDSYFLNRSNGSAVFFTNNTEKMRIDSSGKVGIGTNSPSSYDSRSNNLVVGDSGDAGITIFSGATSNARLQFAPSGSTGLDNGLIDYDNNNDSMAFATGGTERMRIDSQGNIGIGLTPKTDWHTSYPAIQIGQSSAFFANDAGDEVFMVQNARYTSGGWKYNSSGTAALFDMQSGNTRWRRAVSGSDNGAVSWSDSMIILGTNGNVGIGVTDPAHLGRTGSGKVLMLAGDDCQVRLQNSILHHDNSGNTNLYIRNHYTSLGNDNNAKVTLEAGKIVFATSTNYTNRWQIDSSGHFTPSQQHTVDIGGTNAEVRNIYAQGISFASNANAAGASSELLDDYEEGTFTPVVENGTYTYSFRRGHYTKIGNIVHIHIGFKLNAASPNTALGTISGLPFTSMTYGSYQEPHARIGAGGLFVTANLGSHLTFYKGNSNTILYARTSSTNADSPINSNLIWQAGTFIKLQMSYTVS